MSISLETDPSVIDRPPHWPVSQWAELGRLCDIEVLAHGMWVIMEEPDHVLADHHGEVRPDGRPWVTMINGEWPSGWDRRAESVAGIAEAQFRSARNPASRRLAELAARNRPIHWSASQWETLNEWYPPGLAFEAVWLLNVESPKTAIAALRLERIKRQDRPQVSPNEKCWIAGLAAARVGPAVPDPILAALTTFAAARGAAGFTSHEAKIYLAQAGMARSKTSVAGFLAAMCADGLLELIDRSSGVDRYRIMGVAA